MALKDWKKSNYKKIAFIIGREYGYPKNGWSDQVLDEINGTIYEYAKKHNLNNDEEDTWDRIMDEHEKFRKKKKVNK